MGCGEFLVKYILFFANLVFALAGLALLGLGIAAQLKLPALEIIGENNVAAPVTSIVLGSIIFFIAFFGCCGAIRESNCMLITYSIFMLILMAAKLTLSIMIFTRMDDVLAAIPQGLTEAFQKDRVAFQEIERTLGCCGPTGPTSYMNITLPDSCCASTPCTIINAHRGCNSVVQEFVQSFGLAIGITAIAVVAVELVAVVFSLCLANHVRNKERRVRY